MAEKPQSADIHPGPGFRIKRTFERPAPELVAKFAEFESPDISDLMNRLYSMSRDIENLVNDQAIVGVAVTVKVYPGDNLMIHKSLDIAKPGDIVIVDAGGFRSNAVIGDLVASKAKHRGIQGFIIDGLMRDLPACQEVGLPIFAKGVTPVGPLHRGPGEINYPVSCGGIVVNPGDIILGDGNGVAVIRRDFAEDVIERALAKRDRLAAYVADVRAGKFNNDWVDRLLDATDCPIYD
jgi:regulator of RNase E activity RraA